MIDRLSNMHEDEVLPEGKRWMTDEELTAILLGSYYFSQGNSGLHLYITCTLHELFPELQLSRSTLAQSSTANTLQQILAKIVSGPNHKKSASPQATAIYQWKKVPSFLSPFFPNEKKSMIFQDKRSLYSLVFGFDESSLMSRDEKFCTEGRTRLIEGKQGTLFNSFFIDHFLLQKPIPQNNSFDQWYMPALRSFFFEHFAQSHEGEKIFFKIKITQLFQTANKNSLRANNTLAYSTEEQEKAFNALDQAHFK